jgi:hypothetical protein
MNRLLYPQNNNAIFQTFFLIFFFIIFSLCHCHPYHSFFYTKRFTLSKYHNTITLSIFYLLWTSQPCLSFNPFLLTFLPISTFFCFRSVFFYVDPRIRHFKSIRSRSGAGTHTIKYLSHPTFSPFSIIFLSSLLLFFYFYCTFPLSSFIC